MSGWKQRPGPPRPDAPPGGVHHHNLAGDPRGNTPPVMQGIPEAAPAKPPTEQAGEPHMTAHPQGVGMLVAFEHHDVDIGKVTREVPYGQVDSPSLR